MIQTAFHYSLFTQKLTAPHDDYRQFLNGRDISA